MWIFNKIELFGIESVTGYVRIFHAVELLLLESDAETRIYSFIDEYRLVLLLGKVYTSAVSFVTASISMRLHLLFTRHRSRLLSKPSRFETGAKSGAFSNGCGFICRVNSETASILIRLLFCIVQFKIVDLARSAAFAYTITTWIFWPNRLRVNISKQHRFWRGFEVMKPCRCETAFV